MKTLKLHLQLFSFILILIFLKTVKPDQSCPVNLCYGPTNTVLPVQFPFRLTDRSSDKSSDNSSDNSSDRCGGYPGFELTCNKRTRQTIINIPNGGYFTVNAIDYDAQLILISDPTRCLPKRYLEKNFDLTNSSFLPGFTQDFVFFNCSGRLPGSGPADARVVDCLSGDNYTVLAVAISSSYVEYSFVSFTTTFSCKAIRTVSVPGLDGSLLLSWTEPDCRSCLKRGGNCGLKNGSGLNIECSNIPSNGLSRSAKYGIIIGVGIPGLLSLIFFACYLARKYKKFTQRHELRMQHSAFVTQLQPPIIISGIDLPIIESYPKILLGESGRLPNPNNNICSICLSDYQPKEILRTIPKCDHYFHVDCIDEWLRVKGTCPLCRKSPDTKLAPNNSSSTSSSSTM